MIMDSTFNKILEDLKKERTRLLSDVSRIDNAILALSGENILPASLPDLPNKQTRKRRKLIPKTGRTAAMRRDSVKWSLEINKVFDVKNCLLPGTVIEELKNNGVPGLDDANVKKSVYATLNRKVSTGELFKNEKGEYVKKEK